MHCGDAQCNWQGLSPALGGHHRVAAMCPIMTNTRRRVQLAASSMNSAADCCFCSEVCCSCPCSCRCQLAGLRCRLTACCSAERCIVQSGSASFAHWHSPAIGSALLCHYTRLTAVPLTAPLPGDFWAGLLLCPWGARQLPILQMGVSAGCTSTRRALCCTASNLSLLGGSACQGDDENCGDMTQALAMHLVAAAGPPPGRKFDQKSKKPSQ